MKDAMTLNITHPEIATQWCYELNEARKPEDFTPASSDEVWWQCALKPTHRWKAIVRNRVKGAGCLYCAGKLVLKEESLKAKYPGIAAEWHSTKNEKDPSAVSSGSSKNVWWKCAKNSQHEWIARIYNRTGKGSGCPYCFNKKVDEENCLAKTHPEIAAEWHPTKNGDLTPHNFTYGSTKKKIWWLCPRGHEYQKTILYRSSGHGCSYCTNRKISKTGVQNSLRSTHPILAAEWHPTKNDLSPEEVVAGSGKKVWWKCAKNSQHEWEAKIAERRGNAKRNGTNCPHCYLQISDPEYRLAAELSLIFLDLQQKKIIKSKEADIFIPSLRLVIEVDGAYHHKGILALERDKRKNVTFEKAGYKILRLRGKGLEKLSDTDIEFNCKFLKLEDVKKLLGQINKIFAGSITADQKEKIQIYLTSDKFQNDKKYHEIRTSLPGKIGLGNFAEERQALIKEWHPTKNGGLHPGDFSLKSSKLITWICSSNKAHVWKARICYRANGGGCPYCSNKKVNEENCLLTISPSLAAEWHPTKNGGLKPKDVVAGSNKKVWWQCTKNPEHAWITPVDVRNREKTGCPVCSGNKVHISNCLSTVNPSLAAEWHPTKNGGLKPKDVVAGSNKKVWWQCSKDLSHEWKSTVGARNRGNKCPICSGRKVDISNCLATVNPSLAAEWHPTKNGDLTPHDFTRGSKKVKIWWLCPENHEYQALILTRSHGHGCPECSRKIKRETATRRWEKYRKEKGVIR